MEQLLESHEVLPIVSNEYLAKQSFEGIIILYSAFVKYLRKNGNTMRQCVSNL
jgi:hypothetical protein